MLFPYLSIRPSDLGVSNGKMTGLKSGAVLMTCKGKNELEKIRNETVAKLGDRYDVKIPSLNGPKIKIVGLDEEYDGERLKFAIINQNKFVPRNASIKQIVCKKMKMRWFSIIQCDAETFKSVIDNGALCVEFNACQVYEYVDVRRCFNCYGFFHNAKNCSKPVICLKCGRPGHNAGQCKADVDDRICPNCMEANEKLGLELSEKHSPFAIDCPVLRRHTENLRRHIDYGVA